MEKDRFGVLRTMHEFMAEGMPKARPAEVKDYLKKIFQEVSLNGGDELLTGNLLSEEDLLFFPFSEEESTAINSGRGWVRPDQETWAEGLGILADSLEASLNAKGDLVEKIEMEKEGEHLVNSVFIKTKYSNTFLVRREVYSYEGAPLELMFLVFREKEKGKEK